MTGQPAPRPSRRIFLVAAAGTGLIAAIAVATLVAGPAAFDRARQGSAAPAADGVQEITVRVAGGVYSPNVLRARAGVPLRLRVEVRERHACASKLLIPDLKLDFDLPGPGTWELPVPAAPAGSYLFTCGLRMVKGTIVLE